MLNKTESADPKALVVIKKYANRRLYNTETSTYVTLEDLAAMVRRERDFVVFDAKSGDDLTHAVLTQIIVEEESRAGTQTLLPIPFLRQLIRFYGDTMERMVPSYLQASLDTLTREQSRFRKQFTTAFTPVGAFEAYQEQARKNLALFEQAMSVFAPFNAAGTETEAAAAASEAGATPQGDRSAPDTAAEAAKPAAPSEDAFANHPPGSPSVATRAAFARSEAAPPASATSADLAELKEQLATMQRQIAKLAAKAK